MRRPFLFLLIFLVSLAFGIVLSQAGRVRDVYQSICDLTQEHFYRDNIHLTEWVGECRRRAARMSAFAKPDALLGDVQDLMNKMGVSHFAIYSPSEDKALWTGEAIDTGVRARYVEDHLVVYRVLPESAGAAAGMKPGDEILHMSGTPQVTPWGAQHRSGEFEVRRGGRVLTLHMESRTMTPDYSPRLTEINKTTALVEIPSFRSEFFEPEAWNEFVRRMTAYKNVIVDVRENAGGNFVAVLRALSTFHCGGKLIGTLNQPRRKLPVKESFEDDTTDRYQIEELDRFSALGMRTFSNYGCYEGRVTVFTSSDTASVAEIFADSFFRRPNSRVWGQPSAGDVVLAVWYDLPALGPGYSVSIPEAVFLTPSRKELEGSGVWPQKELFYRLNTELKGQDSWVVEAIK